MEQKKSSEENGQRNKTNEERVNGGNNNNNNNKITNDSYMNSDKDNEGFLSASECLKGNKNKREKKNSMNKQKLVKKKIEEHMYYEAHHMIKTMINRSLQKTDVTKCLKIIFYFCPLFAKQNEYAFVCDLMLTCINILSEHNVQFAENCAQKIIDIFNMCLCKSYEDKYKFMNKAIIWSKNEKQPFGYIPFHTALGTAYLEDEKYHLAHNHFIYTDNSVALYEALCAWQCEGYPSEAPYFVLRSVLSLIVLRKFQVAFELLDLYEENLDNKHVPLPIQLAYLINAACVSNSVTLYEEVKYRYRLILNFDPELQNFISEIDARVFNKQKNDIFSFLQNILK